MVGLPGPELTQREEEAIDELGLRHFIFFSRNFTHPAKGKALLMKLKKKGGLLAVDQEGGPVVRLRPPLFTELLAPLALAQTERPEETVRTQAEICASQLQKLGFNLNLAPVLDLGDENSPPFLRGRTFGRHPETVARLGKLYIKTFLQKGLLCCAKHFPGLGEARVDPHEDLPRLEKLSSEALLPFEVGVKAGVPCVMTTHLLVQELDKEMATFSAKITGLLREKLSFNGVILTDDLFMGAIKRRMSLPEAALKAFIAGHDLLLLCQDLWESLETIKTLLPELRSRSLQNRVEESLKRQERLLKYCLPAG